MINMILIDLETQTFDVVLGGIYEVAALVIENDEIKDKLHLAIVEDETCINMGYGYGYEEISNNEDMKNKFQQFISKYNYPLVAHNGVFDRKFLLHYGWITEDYPFYDSIRALKYKNSKMFSYSMAHLMDYIGIEKEQSHTALGDVEILFDILKEFKPDIWMPIGMKVKGSSNNKNLEVLKHEFEVVKNLFVGKNIVFTGKGPYVRNELIELAKKCGANITSNSITKKTNLLVVGEGAGSKLKKAQEIGIEIMDMSDFFELVSGIKLDKKQKEIIASKSKEKKTVSDKLKNEVITLVGMKDALKFKVSEIIEQYNGKALFAFRQKETTLVIYQPCSEDLATVQKAKDKNIKTMTLGKFNKYILQLGTVGE